MRCLLLHAALIASAFAKGAPLSQGDDGPAIAERQEVVFTTPPKSLGAQRATDAPLLGNGDLAACLTGKPDRFLFWVSKNDFWSLKDGSAIPLNFGTLIFDTPGLAGATWEVRQSLGDATTHVKFCGAESTLLAKSFVAANANILVVRLACEGKPLEISTDFQPTTFGKIENKVWDEGPVHLVSREVSAGVDIPVTACVAWKTSAEAQKFTVKEGAPVTLLLAMASNFDGKGAPQAKAQAILAAAKPDALAQSHAKWWTDFWRKSFVEIQDADIMRRYYLSQYTLGSASRNPEFPPAIIGPWATAATGWCGYWMNYNHAAPYYGLYSSNHIEQADPQDTPMLEFMQVGTRHARDILNCRGILYPVGIGPKGMTACGIVSPTTNNNRYEHGICTWGQRTNAAYNLLNMGQRWYTTYDPAYGRKILSYAVAVADFWEDFLVREEDGKDGYRYNVIGDAVHEGSGKNRNPGISIALVRAALLLNLDLGRTLGVNQDRFAKWEDILAHLPSYPTVDHKGNKRIFVLAEQPASLWQNNTVHIQHIYPAGGIGLASSPELLQIARDTIAAAPRWHDGNGSNSFFPAAARVGFAPEAILSELNRYSSQGMSPNGFSAGNIHGIENCSTVPNTIHEMLLQSHEEVIRLFPVWPRDRDARFGTLRARGAFLVSAELKGGVISDVRILSEKGRDCTVVNPWPGRSVRVTRKGKPAETVSDERFTLKTAPGEALTLNPL